MYFVLGALLLVTLLPVLGAILAVGAMLLLAFPFVLLVMLAIPYLLYRGNSRRSYLRQRWRGLW
jgi:uncharacterized protein (DUF58 family)